jgi:hypothetical protein
MQSTDSQIYPPDPTDFMPLAPSPSNSLGWLSAGTGLLGGIAAGAATYISRKEGREMDRQTNRYLGQSAGIARRAGLNAQYTGNQMASGQLNYMLNKAKRNPQAYEALSQLYASTVAQGTQARMQGMQLASQYMAQRKALTNPKYDWIAAIASGITTGVGAGASTYAMFTQPKEI